MKDALHHVCELSKVGNEDSTHWLGIANIFHEMSTSDHLKNGEKGREMNVTADHFETLARINRMKKQSDMKENLDIEARIHERIKGMVSTGACNALCRISTAHSKRTQETVVRTMVNMCKYMPARGPLAAAGGIAVCSQLAKSPHTEVATRAMNSLARMLISTNPSAIRPHQLMDAVVPLLAMSRMEHDSLMQFESTLALTNLASFAGDLKESIVSHDGMVQLEMLQMHDHKMVRRAATECIHNLYPCDTIFERFKEKDGELLDWWTELSEDDKDFATTRAACGLVAMVACDSEVADLIIERKLLPRLVKLLQDWDGEDEIALRVAMLMDNILDAARPPGAGLKALRNAGAAAALAEVDVEDERALKKINDLKVVFTVPLITLLN